MARSITVNNITIGEGLPCICVPLTGGTLAELQQEAESAAAANPDLVEWRADFYQGVTCPKEVEKALKKLCDILGQIPIIFTVRTQKEGGNLQISTEDYVNILKSAASTGKPSLIDVEILHLEEVHRQELIAEIHRAGITIIGSSHHFEGTPSEEEMEAALRMEDKAGADILKLAVMPHSYEDVARLLHVTGQIHKSGLQKPVITMSMGELGSASRFCGEIFGSAVTFATVGKASAPGQLPIEELRQLLLTFHKFT